MSLLNVNSISRKKRIHETILSKNDSLTVPNRITSHDIKISILSDNPSINSKLSTQNLTGLNMGSDTYNHFSISYKEIVVKEN